MRTSLLLLAAATLVPAASAQTTLISESFESSIGDPTPGYTINFEYRQNSANYFFRTNGSNIQAQGNGKYTNEDGSSYVAGRNSDTPGPGTKLVTFDPVDASGFENVQLSFLAATLQQGVFDNNSETDNDFLYLRYSTDGGSTFTPCVAFESDVPDLQGDFRRDTNFDGVGDGALLSVTDFTEYGCTIGVGSANTVVEVAYKSNAINESAGFDLVRLVGDAVVPPPTGISGSIAPGTCDTDLPINRPSETTRCFPQISGTNNSGMEQRFTLFFVIEGVSGPAAGFDRLVKRGEIKLSDGETASNKFSLRTKDTDPDGTYDLVLLAEFGSVSAPTGSAVELDRVTLVKGGGAALRSSEKLSVFPNPANDAATLRFAVEGETAATVTVYDALGRQVLVAHEGTVSGIVEAEVNTAALPAGLYVARLATDSRVETLRFSVVR